MSKQGLYSLKDVQRILQVPRWMILYLYETGQLDEPMRIGGHRIFNEDDIRRIAARLEIDICGGL
ncbi:MAG: MerR family transcriptional regulator [bacterium]